LETLLERIDLLEHHRHPATRARNAEPHHPDACGNPGMGNQHHHRRTDGASEERLIMSEGFRPSPPPPAGPVGYPDPAAARQQEVEDRVQRIMGQGQDIAPPPPAPLSPRAASQNGDSPTTEVAKEQAAEVADTAKQAGAQVADTVREQAGQVTAEARNQAKQLLAQAQSELSEQAAGTQQRVAEGLHALADELSGMARNSEQDGVATDLARQAADRARTAAGWLADRDPGSLLDEVRTFARRKPGTYLALALGAGVLAGRLTRGLTAPTTDHTTGTQGDPGTPSTSAYQVTTGQPALTGGVLPDAPVGYDRTPITDPVFAASPPVGVSGQASGRGVAP
jgi:hypothetical protein